MSVHEVRRPFAPRFFCCGPLFTYPVTRAHVRCICRTKMLECPRELFRGGLMRASPKLKTFFAKFHRSRMAVVQCGSIALLFVFLSAGKSIDTQNPPSSPAAATGDAALLEGFRHVEVASVSDALEQLTGKKMYMTHRMRPIFTSRFAGRALTVLLKKETNRDPDALKGMLHAIDTGGPNSVYVMVVEGGADIAGMGGLMGTAMSARNFSGAVIDGGVRDTAYLQKIGFPVYALGVVPSTSVGHYRFAGANIPVTCDGVLANPDDFLVADSDGVVVVPVGVAPQVLQLAQEMDFKEHSMYAHIERLKSIEQAVAKFGRL